MAVTAPTGSGSQRPKPNPVYPRPPLIHDHRLLFKEPVYTDGRPYTVDDEDEGDGPLET